MDNKNLKNKVYDFWNQTPCESQYSNQEKYSKEYFDEIEKKRYGPESEVIKFAEWPLFKGKKILEVGVGVGSDFIQFIRAGALAYGIDLTPNAIEHTKKRLEIYGLTAKDIRVGDAENISYEENTFDLVYSFGVIHHSPNTVKAFEEIVRVTKPGGLCKIMVYNRHSLAGLYLWIIHGLLKGHPERTLSWIIFNYLENIGTKSYTKNELKKILSELPVMNVRIVTRLNTHHKFKYFSRTIRRINRIIKNLPGGNNLGLEHYIQFTKIKN